MANADIRGRRPLSPHLTIYKPIPTMVMSILHRITGMALYGGAALVAWWLLAAASGPEAYATAGWFFGSWIGILVMFGYTWVLLHHMMGGIRHLIWDTTKLMDKESATKLSIATAIASVSLTALVWAVAMIAR